MINASIFDKNSYETFDLKLHVVPSVGESIFFCSGNDVENGESAKQYQVKEVVHTIRDIEAADETNDYSYHSISIVVQRLKT